MPTRITIECSHCGAKLNLADSSKLGKKIKCPKCSEVFVASSDELDDDFDELEDDEADDEMPMRRGKKSGVATAGKKGTAKSGKGKKGKKKSSGSNMGLIIGGAVGAVVLLGGLVGVLFAVGLFSGAVEIDPNQIIVNSQPGSGAFSALLKEQVPPGPKPIPARGPVPEVAKWLPADTEFVVHFRPADVLDSPLVKDVLKSMQFDKQLDAATAEWGIKPADIESVTIGVAQLDKAQQQIQQAQMAMMTGGPPPLSGGGMPALGVIKLKKPVTYDDLTKFSLSVAPDQPVNKVQHAGKEYLESKDPKTNMTGSAYLASDTIIVTGDTPSVKAAMEQGAVSKPLPNFGFVDWTDQLTLAIAPQDSDAMRQQMSAGMKANPMLAVALRPIAEGADGFSLGLTVKGGVEAEIAVGCTDAEKTESIVKSLTDLIEMGRGQYSELKSQLPPWAQPLTDEIVNNVKVAGSNRVVLVDTNIPDSAQAQLAQLPGMLMAQFMMSAALGGNRGPGGAQQTAREAAGRTQSKNNLKQILLALHNYHDAHREFPVGVIEGQNTPEQSISWFATILPYVDQAALNQQLKADEAWDSKANAEVAKTPIPIFLDPAATDLDFDGFARTDYAGVAGLGADGPNKAVDEKGAGIFAYNRGTRIRDILDGTSNTIAIGDISQERGPWLQGGKSTIRPFVASPYINGPDGWGGIHVGGAHFGLADGSVRFISENIDPNVLEALVTIQGGEVVTEDMLLPKATDEQNTQTTPSVSDSSPVFTSGEPSNVKAASAKGLPKTFELTGSLQDGFSFEFDANGKPKKPGNVRNLNFSVQLGFSGPEDQCVIGAIGKLMPGEAQTAGGKKIELAPNQLPGPNEKLPDFVPILNFPEFGGVSASLGAFELEIPADETEALKSLSGSFQFVTGKKSKLLQVKDIRSQAGKKIMDPVLKAAGLEIKLEKRKDAFGEAEVAVISVKEGYLLSELQAIDSAGEWNFDATCETGPRASADSQAKHRGNDIERRRRLSGVSLQRPDRSRSAVHVRGHPAAGEEGRVKRHRT